jgi:hypothetical protein
MQQRQGILAPGETHKHPITILNHTKIHYSFASQAREFLLHLCVCVYVCLCVWAGRWVSECVCVFRNVCICAMRYFSSCTSLYVRVQSTSVTRLMLEAYFMVLSLGSNFLLEWVLTRTKRGDIATYLVQAHFILLNLPFVLVDVINTRTHTHTHEHTRHA